MQAQVFSFGTVEDAHLLHSFCFCSSFSSTFCLFFPPTGPPPPKVFQNEKLWDNLSVSKKQTHALGAKAPFQSLFWISSSSFPLFSPPPPAPPPKVFHIANLVSWKQTVSFSGKRKHCFSLITLRTTIVLFHQWEFVEKTKFSKWCSKLSQAEQTKVSYFGFGNEKWARAMEPTPRKCFKRGISLT